jgi:hypothetical protein
MRSARSASVRTTRFIQLAVLDLQLQLLVVAVDQVALDAVDDVLMKVGKHGVGLARRWDD